MIPQRTWIATSARQSRGIQIRQSLRIAGPARKKIVYDHFKRPGFEQVQANAYQRKKQSEDRLP